jgi:hypothetical protein
MNAVNDSGKNGSAAIRQLVAVNARDDGVF